MGHAKHYTSKSTAVKYNRIYCLRYFFSNSSAVPLCCCGFQFAARTDRFHRRSRRGTPVMACMCLVHEKVNDPQTPDESRDHEKSSRPGSTVYEVRNVPDGCLRRQQYQLGGYVISFRSLTSLLSPSLPIYFVGHVSCVSCKKQTCQNVDSCGSLAEGIAATMDYLGGTCSRDLNWHRWIWTRKDFLHRQK